MRKYFWGIIIGIIIVGSGVGSYFIFFNNNDISDLTVPEFYVNGILVNDFAYQLQDININDIASSGYDLIIIDYSADGTKSQEYTQSQVYKMKESSNQKILVSYMSIGEAENYRFYWNNSWDANNDGIPDVGAPNWLDVENPEWEGNYKVKYWEKDWQQIIFGTNNSYLDKIIAAGFDGCYLDIIDAFEYYEDTRPTAKQDMIDFVIAISNYAKVKKAGFLVIPQNGESLLTNTSYRKAIDGIGREDVYFLDNKRRSDQEVKDTIDLLKLLTNENKIVMIVDYPTIYSKVKAFYELAYNDGFLAYAPPRDLDKLVYYPDFPPD